ncbi:MAG: type I methionyl aminopeptidase [Deltaproteobacteria bacterium]|nr:type I methionyl aminopeptidase [Deltaproteobacteria bacterium]
MIYLKTKEQIEKIRLSGQLAAQTLDYVAPLLVPGITTKQIDKLIYDFIVERGAYPATLGYGGSRLANKQKPFPASCCISINNVVVHGIPGTTKINDGDLVKIDVTTILDGYFGDTARTFLVGNVSDNGVRLCQATKKSLDLAIETVRPGSRIGDIGAAIQEYIEAQGFSVVRFFVGHGVGLKFHEDPSVPHFGQRGTGYRLRSGMVFTIEPMINEGVFDVKILEDGWTAVTVDGKLSAQFEHTVAVTEDGHEILTLP